LCQPPPHIFVESPLHAVLHSLSSPGFRAADQGGAWLRGLRVQSRLVALPHRPVARPATTL